MTISSGYTAASDGFAFISKNGSGGNDASLTVSISSTALLTITSYSKGNASRTIPLGAGQKITWSWGGGGSSQAIFGPSGGSSLSAPAIIKY